ncbi:F-box protein pof6 [Escovopsis weberi]|uniref:F-box protein pof6 n=1 Tax=Escovopsis weberi TaxID=150374 RepID=A0A0M9VSA7_ESCWE|nr:F-box protein pof6 [Escovopsis weberi]
MYRPKGGGGGAYGNRGSILQALKATEMLDSRSRLPAEIIVTILNHLPVADQMRAARASRRFQEMVYDDTRWVSRLKSMGCWDEREARQRFEDSVRRRREAAAAHARGGAAAAAGQRTSTADKHLSVSTLFDATVEEQRRKVAASDIQDGFETMTLGTLVTSLAQDPGHYLDIFGSIKSVRGGARHEFARIYGALAPFYFDIMQARSHADPIVFQAFRDPEEQARMLANLRRFSESDWSEGWGARQEKLESMMGVFESAVLREFDQGYEVWDVDGRMRRYAHVLHTLNGARGGIEFFIQKHPIFDDAELEASNPIDCLNQAGSDDILLEPSQRFFEKLLAALNEQADIVGRVFPDPAVVFWELVEKVGDEIIAEYTTPLFDEAHERSILSYLKAVSGIFEQTLRFFETLKPPGGGGGGGGSEDQTAATKAKELTLKIFEPHLDLYLQEELDFFTKQAESVVSQWEKKLSEQDSSLESFYMSNINRSAEKKDFLSSFKKVIMMPVTVLPSFPMGSPFAASKPTATTTTTTTTTSAATAANGSPSAMPSQPETSGLGGIAADEKGQGSPMPGAKAPTDELAAKAAIMASKLEGIKSLFSIEVALTLVHQAKTSLGRASVLIPLGSQVGGEAKEQCAGIFMAMVRILGQRHVKSGFEMAVDHLSHYNPREVIDHNESGVAPLVTFIELVNVGDLISQMIDVFYEQQLAAPKIADKNDFLDPAGLAKKKFEQMLDESVAAGLNKGIDVLMDEVEYLQGTMQMPTDYNPSMNQQQSPLQQHQHQHQHQQQQQYQHQSQHQPSQYGHQHNNHYHNQPRDRSTVCSMAELDIGPTQTAERIVELVRSHTNMLVGTTEKSMLDVFNGEVGQRLFTAICKHLKRQRISTDGAIKLIADMNLYSEYIRTLRNAALLPYFRALRELSQIYLIDPGHAKEMATVIADQDRFGGVFRAEEVYEYAQRRADWYQVRKSVERAMYGMDCTVM